MRKIAFPRFQFRKFSWEGYFWTHCHMAHTSRALLSLMAPQCKFLKMSLEYIRSLIIKHCNMIHSRM